MQLVILHYHLNRGGVTSVIENHLRALALLAPHEGPTRVAIVYGGRAAAWNHEVTQQLPFECSLVAVPGLEYDHLRSSTGSLHEALQPVLDEFDRDQTVLHIHNHSLGKNAAIAPLVCRLADAGWRLLLQIHDFAEDLRPTNYGHLLSAADSAQELHNRLYPQAAQIHYAVLNRRDDQILTQAGIAAEQLHLLPNPVKAPHQVAEQQPAAAFKAELKKSLDVPTSHQLILYPVRAIRRKNLGELLLWSLLVENATFIVTLAPLNPQELATYEQWVEFAHALQLPVQFDSGSRCELPFEAVYASSDAIITTSVAEGFGMVYLEASLAGKPLVGRSLPGVCDDFLAAGMQFPGLAEEMVLPSTEIDIEQLQQTQARCTQQLRTAYGLPPETAAAAKTHASPFAGDTVDFGRLELSQQQSLLRRVKNEAELRSVLRKLNPHVQRQVPATEFQRTLENNRQVIAENYSMVVIGEKLSEVYRQVLASPQQSAASRPEIAQAILNHFVHPSQLFPIRLVTET